MKVDISRFAGYNRPAVERQSLSLDELTRLLAAVEPLKRKTDGKLWSPVRYRPGASSRNNDGVEAVTCFVYDLDGVEPDWAKLEPYTYTAHTTWSHTAHDPRYRVILPLVAAVAVEQWQDAWRRGRAALCPEADPSCKDPSRAYYLPASRALDDPAFTPPDTREHAGELLDPGSLPTIQGDARRTGGPRRTPVTGRDATVQDRYRARRYADAVISNLAAMTPGTGRNDALNRAAWTLGGWVAATALDLSDVKGWLYGAAQGNGLVAEDGPRACWATIHSGLDAGLQEPVDLDAEEEVEPGGTVARGTLLRRLSEQERGDAELLKTVTAGTQVFDSDTRTWYRWTSGTWRPIPDQKAILAVTDLVANAYLSGAAELNLEAQGLSGTSRDQAIKQAEALTGRARRLQFQRHAKDVLELAKGVLSVQSEQWDADPWLLGVANGVLDLRSGDFRDARPDDYIRTAAPTKWHGLAVAAPRFEQFIGEIFEDDVSGELVDYLQRLLGYGLVGKVVDHVLPILWGEAGRNGKDTLLGALGAALGPLAGAVSNDVLVKRKDRQEGAPAPHLMALRGKRIVWASETAEGERLNAAQIKWLTGGGKITARPPYGRAEVSWEPTHTLLLMTNYRPHAPADDDATWHRLALIPFVRRFVANPDPTNPNERQADAYIGDKLREETPGILAWLVRGCLEWQRCGLQPPKSVKVATEEYRQDEDTVGQFIEQCCETEPAAGVSASELYRAYKGWCQETGANPMNGNALGRRLGKRFERAHTRDGDRYLGLRVRPEAHW